MSTAGKSAWSYEDEAYERYDPADETQPESSDRRSAFGHDRDRIIYSTAFRRLAGKAQVVAAQERGLFHTRLTHTLKVAQLGRRMAEQLRAENFDANGPPATGRITAPDPDLVEAACLAHDIGHPPFGHVGERAIQSIFDDMARDEFIANKTDHGSPPGAKKIGDHVADRGGFDANAQTFRLLCYLSVRVALKDRNGLNLTRAVLDATVKYPWTRAHTSDVGKDKWNTYGGKTCACHDLEVMTWVRNDPQAPLKANAPQAFECQLMEWADDVTYVVHDLMDFFRSGQVPLDSLLLTENDEISEAATEFFVEEFPSDADDQLRDRYMNAWVAMAQEVDALSSGDGWRAKGQVQVVTNQLITYFLKDIGWVERGALGEGEFMRGTGRPMRHEADLVFGMTADESEQKYLAVQGLKRVIEKYIHKQPALRTMEHGQTVIIERLIERFYKHPDMVPLDRQEERDGMKDDDDDQGHGDELRTAADHVASLTEEGALALYRRLFGVDIGSLSDLF